MTRIKVDLTDLSMTGEQRTILAPYFASTKANAEGWIKLHCPIHGDSNPSAGVNVISGWWVCQACGERGTIARLIARQQEWKPPDYDRIIGEDSEWAPTGMVVRAPQPEESLPQSKDLEEYSRRLLTKYREPLEYLETERGIDPATIERFKIGYRPRENGGDFILPMWHDGALVNVRYYNPTRIPKVLNHTGYGTIGLFPDNVIPEHAKLVIVEGEWDCYVTMQHLEKYGYTVRTFTNGTGAIRKLYSDNMAIKRIVTRSPAEVITIFDCDEPGRAAAAHLAKLLPTKDVLLPYPVTEDGGKDLTDFWQERRGRPDEAERQLLDLVTDDTNEGSGNARSQPPGDGSPRRPRKQRIAAVSAPVREARRPGRVVQGRTDPLLGSPDIVSCDSLHSALTDPKFDDRLVALNDIQVLAIIGKVGALPRTGKVVGCGRQERAVTPPCDHCPKNGKSKKWSLSLTDDRHVPIFSECFGQDRSYRLKVIHKRLEDVCNFAQSDLIDNISYQKVMLRQRGSNDLQPAICAYEGRIHVGQLRVYQVIARVLTSAKHEEKTLLILDVKETTRKVIPQPKQYATPPENYGVRELREFLDSQSDQIALKYTGIFGQTLLHLVLSLWFASPQEIMIGERKRESGRLDIAIIGPTRTGKTLTAEGVAKAFGHDDIDLRDSLVSAENASLVGLLGTSQTEDGQWYVKPGVFPRNHGGYVIVDEIQYLARGRVADGKAVTMGELNTVRSSGIVNITKAADVYLPAEVRFAAIMNPPEGMTDRLIEAILETYIEPQVRSRTDLVLTIDGVSRIERLRAEEDITGEDTSPLAEAQLPWKAQAARIMPAERIVFPRGGVFVSTLNRYCDEYAKLYNEEHDHIGVMHPQTVQLTLLRLTASIAILAMSFDHEHQVVLPKKVHLDLAKEILDEVNEQSGYAGLMRERSTESASRSKAINAATRKLVGSNVPAGQRRTVEAFVSRWNDIGFRIDPADINWGHWKTIADELGELMRQGLLVKDKGGKGTGWIMSPEFRKALGEALRQRDGDA